MFGLAIIHHPRHHPSPRGPSPSSSRRHRSTATALFLFTAGVLLALTVALNSSVPAPSAAASDSPPQLLRGLVTTVDGSPHHPQQQQAAPGPGPGYEAQALVLGKEGGDDNLRGRRRRRQGRAGAEANATSTSIDNVGGWWRRNLDRTVLLVVASADRPAYLQRCLASVLALYPGGSSAAVPAIAISEDGASEGVRAVVEAFRAEFAAMHGERTRILHLHHPPQQQPSPQAPGSVWEWLVQGLSLDAGPAALPPPAVTTEDGYHRLARHYRWALTRAFSLHERPARSEDKVLVLEEDLDVAPDFFAYFGALAPLLDRGNETGLMAISAWHDNGMADRVLLAPSSLDGTAGESLRVHRTDFFGGLGWMLTRPVWENELESAWPAVYWDDWLRAPEQRRGRHFLRPEVSRTHHFGRRGTSNGQFSPLLEQNRLSEAPASAWDDEREVRARVVGAVADAGGYDRALAARIEAAEEVEWAALQRALPPRRGAGGEWGGAGIRVLYESLAADGDGPAPLPSFPRLAGGLGLFEDVKSGVPRAAYKGIVSTYVPAPVDAPVYLVPQDWRERLSR